MSLEIIGKQIASLRKEQNLKQEDLAKAVGVSAQAVSKWENGGVPDTELLSKIADFFNVSVDSLFGREIDDKFDLHDALIKKLNAIPEDERIDETFEYCFDLVKSLMPNLSYIEDGRISDCEKGLGNNEQVHSQITLDNGFVSMGLCNRSQYFLVVPDPKSTEKAYFEGVDFCDVFRDLSNEDFFNTLLFMYKRESTAQFTSSLLEKNLGFTPEKAEEMLGLLKKYRLVHSSSFEIDDEVKQIYTFNPNQAFVAILIFVHDLRHRPNRFIYSCTGRTTPYLK